MTDVLPITVPTRAELWQRVQLARSVLDHRPATPDTNALAARILDGTTQLESPPIHTTTAGRCTDGG